MIFEKGTVGRALALALLADDPNHGRAVRRLIVASRDLVERRADRAVVVGIGHVTR